MAYECFFSSWTFLICFSIFVWIFCYAINITNNTFQCFLICFLIFGWIFFYKISMTNTVIEFFFTLWFWMLFNFSLNILLLNLHCKYSIWMLSFCSKLLAFSLHFMVYWRDIGLTFAHGHQPVTLERPRLVGIWVAADWIFLVDIWWLSSSSWRFSHVLFSFPFD